MAKLPQEAMDFLNDLKALKLIATADAVGNPNVAAKGSVMAIDDETIAYVEMAGTKTKANLEATKKAAVLACKGMKSYQAKGVFQGFQTSGNIFQRVAKQLKEAFNLDAKNVGIIKVEEVYCGSKKLA
jgi:predicted pyridoxine 5'-phosphate oxidase superfamily flavin-nucleotide-binding protein